MTLYIDTTSNRLLVNLNLNQQLQPQSLPFFYGDTLPVRVYLLQRLTNAVVGPTNSQFSIIPTTGLSLALYLTNGLVGVALINYTNQVTWQTDSAQEYFYADLPMNTAGLLGIVQTTAPNPANAYLQVGYTDGAEPVTVLNQIVRIGIGAPPAAIVIPPGFDALSVQVANATYVPIAGVAGMPIYLISPSGKKIALMAVDDGDGGVSFQANPLS